MSVRGRRMVLAAAAALVFAVGWLVVVRTGASPGGPVGVDAVGPMSIWPESPFDPPDALTDAQARVESGKDRWRLRPDAVVAHYAQSVFGWVRLQIDDAADLPPMGPITLHVHPDCDPCGPGEGGVDVTVDRLLHERPDSVWSVVAVESPGLVLPVEAGDTVVAGDTLSFRFSLTPDRHAAVGVRFVQRLGAAATDCPEGFAGNAALTGSEATVDVPDPLFDDEACTDLGAAGYVFAYTTPKLTVMTGDPMLEPVYITDVSIVPVLFSQEPVAAAG